METGMAKRILVFRSMRGRSGKRFGSSAGFTSQAWATALASGSYMVPQGIFAPGSALHS